MHLITRELSGCGEVSIALPGSVGCQGRSRGTQNGPAKKLAAFHLGNSVEFKIIGLEVDLAPVSITKSAKTRRIAIGRA